MCVIYNVGIMNGEVGPSGAIGTVGTSVATAGVAGSVMGTGMGAEINTGVGFDSGSPTFSGLGRSDLNIPSFNQSIFNPGETRPFIASSGSVPEGPVKGDIFSNMKTIATNHNLGSAPISSAEPVSVFDNTSDFQPTIPVNESPFPFSLENTFIIAKAGDPADQILGQPEINVESALESYLETSDAESTEITAETLTQAVEDLKVNDPLVYAQLKSDLESVDVILDLVDQVGADAQTSASISNQAIETAVQRSGLIEAVEGKADTEAKTETEASSQSEAAFTNTATETRNATDTQRQDNPLKKSDDDYIWDEEANAARDEDAALAIDVTFETGVDPETGKVMGEDVVAAMNPTPSDKEKSKLAKEEGIDGDGSYDGLTQTLEHKVFDSEEEARAAAKDAILSNPGVERGKGKTKASDEQQVKVLRGGKPKEKQLKMSA